MRARILPPLILAIAVLLGTFLLVSYGMHQRRVADSREKTVRQAADLTAAELKNYVDLMSASLESIVRDERLEQALAAKDDQALLELGMPLFKKLQGQFHIDHFYFHLPDRINLARIHEPDHSGDLIDRVTLKDAQRTGRPASGIEQGPTGNCTLRVVYPWRSGDALIGYVELGTEFETVAERVHRLLNVDLVVAVDKKLLSRKHWEKRNQKLGRQTAWADYPDLVVIDKTITQIPDFLRERLSTGMAKHGEDEVVRKDRQATQVVFLPFTDVSGRDLGHLVVLRDISDVVNEASQSIMLVSLVCIMVGAVLVTFFYIFLGRVGRDLQSRSEQLADANSRLGEANDKLGDLNAKLSAANAKLGEANETLEGRVRQRTEELEEAHRKLVEVARHAGMAEVATGVLHNVGNVLNSVNVSANLIARRIGESEVASLMKLSELIRSRRADLADFLSTDERGKMVPDFIADLAQCLGDEQRAVLAEMETLAKGVEHISRIVAAQQSLARRDAVLREVEPAQIIEAALAIQAESLARHGIEVERRFEPISAQPLDEHKILQVLINLINNAAHAVKEHAAQGEGSPKRIVLTLERSGGEDNAQLRFSVSDTGVGIAPENLTRIFGHGFTTRQQGHGFGLHSSANTAAELGGTLSVQSEGLGRGATFTLELPVHRREAVEA